MKNLPFKLLSLVMFLSMIASPVVAMGPQADKGDLKAQGIEPPTRPEPELVPEEIRELFEDGMSVDEFLAWNQGPVPNAIAEYADLPLTVIVQLDQPGLIAMKQRPDRGVGFDDADYVNQLLTVQDGVISQIQLLSSDAIVMGQYTKVLNGFMARVKAADLAGIRSLAGVKSVTRAPEHKIDLAYSAPLTNSDLVWQLGETGYTGRDVTVAVIDTGIDYTHAMFGTLGDPGAYAANDPDIIEGGTFPTPKVIGGYDFAGTNYDAGGNYGSPIPVPDPDPIDEGGHGTHVASTVAGVDAGFGSGMAPDAKLYALKVFGAEGSTNLVIDAIEWAMDPNGDGYIDDHVDVINMSLGSSFGPALEDDPEYLAVEAANAAGVMVVASAGNAGNNSYITGSPGNTDSALAVAASTTGFETLPYISYNSGSEKIPYLTSYNPFTSTITADLVAVDALDGDGTGLLCSADGVGDLTGKIALIQRGACSFYVKINNAEALGAVAAIIYNNQSGTISMNTTGSTLPAGSILQSDGLLLKSLAPIMVSVGPDSQVETFVSYTPADTIASFSSRGPRGFDSMLKPEITAPGVAIFAANMGSGNKGVSMSGTSMAAPHIAGIAALVKEAHPTWTNEQIKAALMNTAVDLADPASAEIPRQGAGRVDAFAAVTTDVVAVADSKFVSMNWGVVEVTEDTFASVKTVTLRNFSDLAVTLDVGSLFTSDSTGATLTPGVETVTIPAFGKATVDFTLVLDMRQMPIDFADMEEYYGYVTFSGTDTDLRVPFYVVPRPYTEITELDSDTNIELEDTGWIDLEQSGPVASSLWGFPVTMVSDNDPAVIDMADLRYVGMDYGGLSPYGEILVPSFAMWDDQHTVQPYWSEVDLWVYGDADQPVVNFNYNLGWYTGAGVNNQWVVIQVDYNDGMLYLASPYFIYTDYNSGFQEWYLPAPYQYIADEFDYEVVSYDWFGTYDYAGAASFDITKPPLLAVPYDSEWTGSYFDPQNEAFSLLFGVNDPDGYALSQPEGVMLVDYFGKPGVGQAYFWPVNIVDPLLINEFSISTTGTDVEYIELIGTPDDYFSGYTLLEIEGDSSGAGTIDEVIDLEGRTDSDGLWLEELDSNTIENGTVTLLLVKGSTGAKGDDLDIDNDGVLDEMPWDEIIDAVAVYDGGSSDRTYGEPVMSAYYDGLHYAPGGASRIPDGMDTDTLDDWVRNDFDLFGIQGYEGSPDWHEAINTPGELNELCVDTTPPSYYIGGAYEGNNRLPGDLENGYKLLTTQDPAADDHLIQLSYSSDVSEMLVNEYTGLYLSDSTVSDANLKAYYDANVPDPYLTYLKDAVDGANPFVYIKLGDELAISLVDAAKHDLDSNDVDMTVPDDFPIGKYTVTGEFEDTAGLTTPVTLILIVTDELEPPELTITGATADSVPMDGDLETGYILETTNDSEVDHHIQFADGSVSNEALMDEYFGLYLTSSTVSAQELKDYYVAHGTPTEPVDFLTYLQDAVDGENPFVYIKGDPNDPYAVSLVDAAKYDLLAQVSDMTVPDDFPLGTYTVTGTIMDQKWNETEVELILVVSGDRESPELTITGATADGNPMSGDLENGYQLVTFGNPSEDHLIQFAEGTDANEPLADEYFGLYLIDSTVTPGELETYYTDRGVPEPYLTYLIKAANAENPFVYIKGLDVTLVDAAKHDLGSVDVDMTVPDDFPEGTYTVQGVIKDEAGNETTVTLKLIVIRGFTIYLPLIIK